MASQEQAPDSSDINNINDEKLMDETVGIGRNIYHVQIMKTNTGTKPKSVGIQ